MNSLEEIVRTKSFAVPTNQRGYSWETSNIEALINDLKLVGDKSHYLGPIIISEDEDGSDPQLRETNTTLVEERLVEDGQQRLTTFFLMLNALRKRYNSLDMDLEKQQLERLVFYTLDSGPQLRLKNKNPDLNACFSNCMIGSPPFPAELTSPMVKMQNASIYIEDYFSALSESECNRWKNRLCTQSKFEEIDLNTSNFDRWLTFDAINSRGLPLSQFDKIKNLCVLIADKRNLSVEPSEVWYSTLKQLEKYGVSKRIDEEAFIIEIFSVFLGKKYTSNDIHGEFLKKFGDLLKESNRELESQLVQFISFWDKYAASFGLIASKNKSTFFGSECNEEAGRWLVRLDNMDLPTITRPILVTGHMKYDEQDFARLVELCEKYTFRVHAVMRKQTSFNGGKVIGTANGILLSHSDLDNFKKWICSRLMETAPLNQVVQRLFNGDPKYNNDDSVIGWQYCYYFLYEYESKYSPRCQPPRSWASSDSTKKNTQEHILPNTHRDRDFWETEWPDENQAEKYKHRLGNLVLTDGNSQLGRKSFSEKLNGPGDYFYNSPNATNTEKRIREFTEGNEWKIENILKREIELIEFTIDRWSLPCCRDNMDIYLPDCFNTFINMEKIPVVYEDCIEDEDVERDDDLEIDEDPTS